MPMSLVALTKMGANQITLDKFFEVYSADLEKRIPPSSTHQITAKTWKEFLGRKVFYGDYQQFFLGELESILSKQKEEISKTGSAQEESGMNLLLQKYLPLLFDGLMGGLYHPLILIGYALELQDPLLACDGLAHLCFSYMPLKEGPERPKEPSDPLAILYQVAATHPRVKEFDQFYSDLDFPEKFRILQEDKFFSKFSFELETPSMKLFDRLWDITTALYSTQPNIVFLHCITSLRALKIILNILPPETQHKALHSWFKSLIALYIFCDKPPLLCLDPPTSVHLAWSDVLEKATNSTDPHVIKLVYALWSENEQRSRDLNLFLAAEKTGLVHMPKETHLRNYEVPIPLLPTSKVAQRTDELKKLQEEIAKQHNQLSSSIKELKTVEETSSHLLAKEKSLVQREKVLASKEWNWAQTEEIIHLRELEMNKNLC